MGRKIPKTPQTAPTGVYSVPAGLRLGSCLDLISELPEACPKLTLIHADPPWEYENRGKGLHGAADHKYSGLPCVTIRDHLISAYFVAAPNSYLAVWVTFPKLLEWAAVHKGYLQKDPAKPPLIKLGNAWTYITGGAWGKTGGLGPGFHLRGDAELVLLYKKGAPRARTHASNLWLEKRRGHSWKALTALRTLVELTTGRGGQVLDLYAGDSGDLSRVCTSLGREYFGSEIDPKRYQAAQLRIAQGELPGMELALPRAAKPKGPREDEEPQLVQMEFIEFPKLGPIPGVPGSGAQNG